MNNVYSISFLFLSFVVVLHCLSVDLFSFYRSLEVYNNAILLCINVFIDQFGRFVSIPQISVLFVDWNKDRLAVALLYSFGCSHCMICMPSNSIFSTSAHFPLRLIASV